MRMAPRRAQPGAERHCWCARICLACPASACLHTRAGLAALLQGGENVGAAGASAAPAEPPTVEQLAAAEEAVAAQGTLVRCAGHSGCSRHASMRRVRVAGDRLALPHAVHPSGGSRTRGSPTAARRCRMPWRGCWSSSSSCKPCKTRQQRRQRQQKPQRPELAQPSSSGAGGRHGTINAKVTDV